tara:strand:- start:1909 stop:2214 length:306 start_codon:yes stop_codon:yes gene_type:complete
MASARVKIGHIAGKRGISMTNAKRYYYDKLDANARGERLPFHKWKKSNLGYSNVEGAAAEDTPAAKGGFLKKTWEGKGGKIIILGGGALIAYMLWKKFGKK